MVTLSDLIMGGCKLVFPCAVSAECSVWSQTEQSLIKPLTVEPLQTKTRTIKNTLYLL